MSPSNLPHESLTRQLNWSSPYRGKPQVIPLPHLRSREEWITQACIMLNRWQRVENLGVRAISLKWQKWEHPDYCDHWLKSGWKEVWELCQEDARLGRVA